MAIALSTSKRKFDKLLDNLTNDSPKSSRSFSPSSLHRNDDSTTSLATVQPSADTDSPTTKRLRSSPPSIRELARERIEAKKKATELEAGARALAIPRKQPNYVPGSQDAFLARLKTFADVKLWTPKPDAIGEVEWAKRGWICEGINTVACKGGCEQRIVVRLRRKRKDDAGKEIEGSEDYSAEVDEVLVGRYKEIMVNGHEERCHWRRAGCKEDIYHLPLARRSYWQTGLVERYKSLEGMKEKLPERVDTPTTAQKVDSLMQHLPEAFFGEGETSQTAVKFALYGWRGDMIGSTALGSCSQCFARIGLWMYKREESQGANDQDGNAPRLNLVESHRYHCPWRNPISQASPSELKDLAGWQVLQRVIMNLRIPLRECVQPPEAPQTPRPVSVAVDHMARDDIEMLVRPSTADVVAADKARLSRLARLKRMMTFKTKSRR